MAPRETATVVEALEKSASRDFVGALIEGAERGLKLGAVDGKLATGLAAHVVEHVHEHLTRRFDALMTELAAK